MTFDPTCNLVHGYHGEEEDPLLFSVKDVSTKCKIHPNTVWKLVWSGQLPSLRIGRRRLISRSSLERFIEEAERAPKTGGQR